MYLVRKKIRNRLGAVLLVCMCMVFGGCSGSAADPGTAQNYQIQEAAAGGYASADDYLPVTVNSENIPAYSGEPYVVLNDNEPLFTASDMTTDAYEYFSDLDALGRCGMVEANVCPELMPTGERGSISHIRPTGWQSVQYDIVEGKSLYNRCHLIGFQLTGENDNALNLITGTRYMNVEGMLPFEDMIADYVKETGNHVLYRVTPVFNDDDLVAAGVQMEALSVEDDGEGIMFNVFAYNVQPGIEIDYATGDSRLADAADDGGTDTDDEVMDYILNTRSKKYHLPDCAGAAEMSSANRQTYRGTASDLLSQGYTPCSRCLP